MSNGYTRVPDALLDVLIEAPGICTKKDRILLYIIRQTYGFGRSGIPKEVKKIALKTKIKRNHVYEVLQVLKSQQIIEETEHGELRICEDLSKCAVGKAGLKSTENDSPENPTKESQKSNKTVGKIGLSADESQKSDKRVPKIQQTSPENPTKESQKSNKTVGKIGLPTPLYITNNITNTSTNTSTDNITYTPSSSGIKTQPESPPREETLEEKRKRIAEEWEQTKRKIAAIEAARTKRGDDDGQSGK